MFGAWVGGVYGWGDTIATKSCHHYYCYCIARQSPFSIRFLFPLLGIRSQKVVVAMRYACFKLVHTYSFQSRVGQKRWDTLTRYPFCRGFQQIKVPLRPFPPSPIPSRCRYSILTVCSLYPTPLNKVIPSFLFYLSVAMISLFPNPYLSHSPPLDISPSPFTIPQVGWMGYHAPSNMKPGNQRDVRWIEVKSHSTFPQL